MILKGQTVGGLIIPCPCTISLGSHEDCRSPQVVPSDPCACRGSGDVEFQANLLVWPLLNEGVVGDDGTCYAHYLHTYMYSKSKSCSYSLYRPPKTHHYRESIAYKIHLLWRNWPRTSMKRRQGRKCWSTILEENTTDFIPGKTHAFREGLKPNPQSAAGGIQTGVLEVKGEKR